jgi:hypothetical protein
MTEVGCLEIKAIGGENTTESIRKEMVPMDLRLNRIY